MDPGAINIKTCLAWVPRGRNSLKLRYADSYKFDNLEDDNINDKMMIEKIGSGLNDEHPIDGILKIDDYDSEKVDSNLPTNFFSFNEKDYQYIENGDPYLQKIEDSSSEDDSENDFKPNDYVLVVGSVATADECEIEVYGYNHETTELFIHHSNIISSFPLNVEFLDSYKTIKDKNYIAICGFQNYIEIWDNDEIDSLEPLAILETPNVKHTDCISCLSNKNNFLISGSHDKSIILWNLDDLTPINHFIEYTDNKINSISLNSNLNFFACGDEDGTIYVHNLNNSEKKKINVGSAIESVCWYSHDPNLLFFSTNKGEIYCYNVEDMKEVWKKSCGENAILTITDCGIPDMILCGSEDGKGFIFKIEKNNIEQVICNQFTKKNIFAIKPNPDIDTLFAIASEALIIWDILIHEEVIKAFNLKKQ